MQALETVSVNGNGNGHHDDGIGPTVELVPVNGRHANGNGHHDKAPEPQQSLFSWAEFMAEEPVKPKGRKQKPQSATLSMFEWGLPWNRSGRRRSWSARGARPQHTGGGRRYVSDRLPLHGHVCGPFLLPIFRWGIDSSSSSLLRQMVHLGKRQAWEPIRGGSLWTWPPPFNVG